MKTSATAALLTFLACLLCTFEIFARVSWFPAQPVYRFPKWSPINLSLVEESYRRTTARAGNRPYIVLIGDSIPHGDGYGRPSETLAARLNAEVPTANITSPSLAYPVEIKLLKYFLTRTTAPLILIEINPKWVVQSWTPDKFSMLDADLNRALTEDDGQTLRRLANTFRSNFIQTALLEEPRNKIKYRLTNFTLYGFAAGGLTADTRSLWAPEFEQEAHPTYSIEDPHKQSSDLLPLYRAYHAMPWETIDRDQDLNRLLNLTADSHGRVVVWVVSLNPVWSRFLHADRQAALNERNLKAKIRRMGIPLITGRVNDGADYRDDMHFTVSGAQKMADQILIQLREGKRL